VGRRNRVAWIVLTTVLLIGVVGILAWLNAMPKDLATTSVDEPAEVQGPRSVVVYAFGRKISLPAGEYGPASQPD
jgi:hypothetical protein